PQPPHPAYQAYPGYPGGPGAPGYLAPPPSAPPMNGFSVASLVAGIVCCLPPLGLILGIVALVQIKKKGQRGAGMAIAGTVLSAISTLLMLLLLVTGGAAELWRGFKEGMDEAARSHSTLDLRTGQCFNLPGDGPLEDREALSVEVVPCAGEHEAEVTGSFTLQGFDAFPGDGRIDPLAERRCEELNWMYARDEWVVGGRMELYYYTPTKESWRLGDRAVTCTFATPKGDRTAGSVRRDPTTVDDAHQLAYLTAETRLYLTGNTVPDAEYAADPDGYRTWARESAGVFADQAEVVRAYNWPERLAGPMERRAGEYERAAAAWRKAAGARDEEAFWDHMLTVDEVVADGPAEVEIRKLLKLPSVPPEYPEDTEGAQGAGDTGGAGDTVRS
ncbi:DUF4190 domain-containing protein, partial [Streptomyces clavuligerus]